jgi:hypothetical protein
MEDKIYISRERYDKFDFGCPVNFKKVSEMSIEELKTAYNTRLVEKNEAHPESAFQEIWDSDMVLISNEIKKRRKRK